MLVLERKLDEVVTIGPDIEILIVRIRGDRVQLGIRAPRNVAVHRKEVWEAIQRDSEGGCLAGP